MGEWMPIESAPRNKAIRILLEPKSAPAYSRKVRFADDCWISLEDCENFWALNVPSGWQPLPEPPSSADAARESE